MSISSRIKVTVVVLAAWSCWVKERHMCRKTHPNLRQMSKHHLLKKSYLRMEGAALPKCLPFSFPQSRILDLSGLDVFACQLVSVGGVGKRPQIMHSIWRVINNLLCIPTHLWMCERECVTFDERTATSKKWKRYLVSVSHRASSSKLTL